MIKINCATMVREGKKGKKMEIEVGIPLRDVYNEQNGKKNILQAC